MELSDLKTIAIQNRKNIETLRDIYFNDLYKIKVKTKTRIEVDRNNQDIKTRNDRKDKLFALVLGIIFVYIGLN